jgi:hypothetical protein
MTEQELRAWSLAISAITQQGKSTDFTGLLKSAEKISNYIKTGEAPPPPDMDALRKRFKL